MRRPYLFPQDELRQGRGNLKRRDFRISARIRTQTRARAWRSRGPLARGAVSRPDGAALASAIPDIEPTAPRGHRFAPPPEPRAEPPRPRAASSPQPEATRAAVGPGRSRAVREGT